MDSSDAGEDAQVEDCRGIGDRDERARPTVEQLQARVEELEEELDNARVRISELEQQLLAKQGGAPRVRGALGINTATTSRKRARRPLRQAVWNFLKWARRIRLSAHKTISRSDPGPPPLR